MRTLSVLLALLLMACSGTSPFEPEIAATLDETFSLRVGQRATLAGGAVTLALEEVLEDSRCPLDVVCVWEGNARLRLRLAEPGGASRLVDLNTAVAPRRADALGYTVELVGLDPQPEAERPVPRDEYAARLRVSRQP